MGDEGYNVIVAENGYQGIVAAENTNFKIVFLDMKMPDIDNIETFKVIKEIDPTTLLQLISSAIEK